MKKKVSIITPTFNSSRTILDNLISVSNQTYKNWEQIIIDNKSNDETLSIIKKNNNKKTIIISEKDNGIYDAINKGIRIAKGEIISVLHSDDIYNDKNVLSYVVNKFLYTNTNIVYGNLVYVRRKNLKKIIRFWNSGKYKKGLFLKGWSPPHPAFFVKKKLYNKYGCYKTNIGTPADLDLMHRFMEKKKIKSQYINKTLIKMRYGGKSNKNILEIIKQNLRILKILKIQFNIIKIFRFIIFKMINRFKQFLVK